MLLKWSRSRKIALSGEAVRLACAAMRLSESSTARLFGSPVSASVAARRSASARLRRFASTGAAWPTDWSMRRRSRSVGAPPMPTSTEPMTSPPTSSGWHTEASGSLPQISHSMISSAASLRS